MGIKPLHFVFNDYCSSLSFFVVNTGGLGPPESPYLPFYDLTTRGGRPRPLGR